MDTCLRINGITKQFPGVLALDNVSFEVKIGEVHAICGENGAGKSTLMNILAGNCRQDSGTVEYGGEVCNFSSVHDAQKNGFAIVYQERSLVGNLSVAENIYANRQPCDKYGLIDKKLMYEQTRAILDDLDQGDISPDMKVGDLSPARQQLIEIAKVLSQNPKVVIFDEPTASVTSAETVIIFRKIRELKARGVTVLYISHRLPEIFEIADRVSVLKDGKYQKTFDISTVTVDDIIRLMVGRDIKQDRDESSKQDEVVLQVDDFSGAAFKDICFNLHKGEILGFAGLAGAGRTELARAIMAIDPKHSGQLVVRGKKVKIKTTEDAIKNGLGYVSEDRGNDGLFKQMSIADNVISCKLKHAAPKGLLKKQIIMEEAEKAREKLKIATPSVRRKVVNLSGGNQQKVVLSKWLLVNPEILIVDEPTRGIDVGTKDEIYAILRKMAADGKSIIMISSELPEVLSLSDRIIVMYNGRITGQFDNRGEEPITEELILKYASGLG